MQLWRGIRPGVVPASGFRPRRSLREQAAERVQARAQTEAMRFSPVHSGPSLVVQSQSLCGDGASWVCSFTHGLLREAFPPPGLQPCKSRIGSPVLKLSAAWSRSDRRGRKPWVTSMAERSRYDTETSTPGSPALSRRLRADFPPCTKENDSVETDPLRFKGRICILPRTLSLER